jgi:hypothetical protein
MVKQFAKEGIVVVDSFFEMGGFKDEVQQR